jgi:hypothetical protein
MTHENEEGDRSPREHYGPWVWTAYRAYNELLRDKIKKRFEAQEGPWMDRLSEVLVEIVNARWEGGRKKGKEEKQLLAKLDQLLSE